MGSGCFSQLWWVGELSGALPWVIQMEHFQQFPCCEHEFLGRRKQHGGLEHKTKSMTQFIFSVGYLHAKAQHTTAMAACSETAQPAVGILKEQLLQLMAFPLHPLYKILPVQVAVGHKPLMSVFPQHSQGSLSQKISFGQSLT